MPYLTDSSVAWTGTSRRQWQRRNTANDRFPARPKGGTQMSQYCVTALKKDWAILCGLRLVLEHLGASEPAIITLKELALHAISFACSIYNKWLLDLAEKYEK